MSWRLDRDDWLLAKNDLVDQADRLEDIARNAKNKNEWNEIFEERRNIYNKWKECGSADFRKVPGINENFDKYLWEKLNKSFDNITEYYNDYKQIIEARRSDLREKKMNILILSRDLVNISDINLAITTARALFQQWKSIKDSKETSEFWVEFKNNIDKIYKRRDIQRSVNKEIMKNILDKLKENDRSDNENYIIEYNIAFNALKKYSSGDKEFDNKVWAEMKSIRPQK